MSTILAYPTKPEDEKNIKAILKALKIPFETNPYNSDFVAKIEQGEKEIREGKFTSIRGKEDLAIGQGVYQKIIGLFIL